MPDTSLPPDFAAELEQQLRGAVRTRHARRRSRRAAAASITVIAVALLGVSAVTSGPASRSTAQAATRIVLPDGAEIVLGDDADSTVRSLRGAFDRRGLQVDVVQVPVPAEQTGRVLALFAPADAGRSRGEVKLTPRSGATTVLVGRAARTGERPVQKETFEAVAAGASDRLRERFVLAPSQPQSDRSRKEPTVQNPVTVRRLVRGAASAAILAAGASPVAVAARLPDDSAEVRVMSMADGSRTEQVTGSDGRFATRRFDAHGTLVSELTEDGDAGVQWERRTGVRQRFRKDGASHDDRFEKWELVYRAQIRSGFTKLAGETTVDGRAAYELVSDPAVRPSSANVPLGGDGKEGVYHVFVDRDTWIPLRSERHTDGRVEVLATTTSTVVPLSDATDLLRPSATVLSARAARKRR